MGASTQVLQTYELVELTLLHLPLMDILFAQRVCRVWHAVFNRSHKIRRALFLLPSSDSMLKLDLERRICNGCWRWITVDGQAVTGAPLMNPLVRRFIRRNDDSDKEGVVEFSHRELLKGQDTSHRLPGYGQPSLAVHDCTASWKRMLMTQPPVKSIAIWCSQAVFHDLRYDEYFQVENEEGVASWWSC